jgi:hypothetical protein
MDSAERLGSSALPRQQSNPEDIDMAIKQKYLDAYAEGTKKECKSRGS